MADYELGPNSAAVLAARADGFRGLARALTVTSLKAGLMAEHGITSTEAEIRLCQAGALSPEEISPDAQARLASERRAIVADLVHQMADMYDIEEREAMYRLCVRGELSNDDVPADVWQRYLDRTIGRQNFG